MFLIAWDTEQQAGHFDLLIKNPCPVTCEPVLRNFKEILKDGTDRDKTFIEMVKLFSGCNVCNDNEAYTSANAKPDVSLISKKVDDSTIDIGFVNEQVQLEPKNVHSDTVGDCLNQRNLDNIQNNTVEQVNTEQNATTQNEGCKVDKFITIKAFTLIDNDQMVKQIISI